MSESMYNTDMETHPCIYSRLCVFERHIVLTGMEL